VAQESHSDADQNPAGRRRARPTAQQPWPRAVVTVLPSTMMALLVVAAVAMVPIVPSPPPPPSSRLTAGAGEDSGPTVPQTSVEVTASPDGAFVISRTSQHGGQRRHAELSHSPADAWVKCASCVKPEPNNPSDPAAGGFAGLAPLTLYGHRQFNGTDSTGSFVAYEWTWHFTESFPLDPFGCNPRRWVHALFAYSSSVRFTQEFPEGMDQQSSCECGAAGCDCSGTSAWPALRPASGCSAGAYRWQLGAAGASAMHNCSTWSSCSPPGAAAAADSDTARWNCSSSAGDATAASSRLFSGAMDRVSCNATGVCRQPMLANDSLLNFGAVGCSNCTQSAIRAGTTIEAVLALAPAAAAVARDTMYARDAPALTHE
jgi:hypothetical protein